MNYKNFMGTVCTGLMTVIAILMLAAGVCAQSKFKTLYKFRGKKDGGRPAATLVFDMAGNLYGTAREYGANDCGVVFQLTPNPDGSWKQKVLLPFGAGSGSIPTGGMIFDQLGNLYGTTNTGGVTNQGTAFRLTRNQDGSWTESILHSFSYNDDNGNGPNSLIFDQAGNLYGTTSYGGAHCCGVVFELTPNLDGSWTYSLLDNVGDYLSPGLTFDQNGNLYGATRQGGVNSMGRVFELTPNSDGSWTESTLYTFRGYRDRDGSGPTGGLIFDGAGNLYGTTGDGGGPKRGGVVFKLTPNADGTWTENVLHRFRGGKDGAHPAGGLIFDQAGNLYGTTTRGGNPNYCGDGLGCGVVFKLAPNAKGGWSETVLHSFRNQQGAFPEAGLIFDSRGNLYGTTWGTGWYEKSFGSVFEITP